MLIARIEKTHGNVNNSGIPIEKGYCGFLTKQELAQMAGTVDCNKTDPITGDSLSLLALKNDNMRIYNFLQSHAKPEKLAIDVNKKGLSTFKLLEIKQKYKAKSHILKNPPDQITLDTLLLRLVPNHVDRSILLLESCERYLRLYLEKWRRERAELEAYQKTGAWAAFEVALSEFLTKSEQCSRRRGDEAQEYLTIVQKALHGNIAKFCKKIQDVLNQCDKGRFNGSELHDVMGMLLNIINDGTMYEHLQSSEKQLQQLLNVKEQEIVDLKHQLTSIRNHEKRNYDERLAVEMLKKG